MKNIEKGNTIINFDELEDLKILNNEMKLENVIDEVIDNDFKQIELLEKNYKIDFENKQVLISFNYYNKY